MAEVQAGSAEIEVLRRMYAAFNQREFETVLSALQDNVDWPNGMEGGRVLGKAAVRAYWKRQFEMLDSKVEPKKFTPEADGRIAIDVHRVCMIRVASSSAIRWCSMCTNFEMG